MSKHVNGIERLFVLALFAPLAFAVPSAMAQPSTAAPAEASPVQTQPATTGPIVHNFQLRKINGTLNVTVNSDGTYDFSGSTGKSFPDKDFDVSLVMKASTGEMILFEYAGDASHSIQFSKQGQSKTLQDNFALFAKGHYTAWDYRFSESAAGRAKIYEEREKKKEELRKEEAEARKRHDEKVAAEKKAALQREEQQEIAEERAKQQQSSSGGGSSVGSVLGTVAKVAGVVGTILSFL